MNKSDLNNTQKQPLVSIVVATYNGERFLREQLDSIIGQSYSNLEIIIQDDGSSDATMTVLETYKKRDQRVQLFQNKKKLGINKNFFDLIAKSTGEYIAISDQDDIWHLNKIETLVHGIGEKSLIYTDSTLINGYGLLGPNTLLQEIDQSPAEGTFLFSLLESNTISGHSMLFHSNITDEILSFKNWKFREGFIYDQLIAVIASTQGGVIYYPKPLTLHRLHQQNNHNKGRVKKKTRRALDFISTAKARIINKSSQALEDLKIAEKILMQTRKDFTLFVKSHELLSQRFKSTMFSFKYYTIFYKVTLNRKMSKKLARGHLFYALFKWI